MDDTRIEDLKKFCDAPPEQRELLRFLSETALKEQDLFWQRFYSFATLQAAAFVVFSTNPQAGTVVAIAGIVLGMLWLYVQWASLYYCDRTKDIYRQQRERLGITYNKSGLFARLLERYTWASATDAAVLVSFLVLSIWVVVCFKN